MEPERGVRLAALEADRMQLQDDLATLVAIVAKLIDAASGLPTPGHLDSAETTLAALQRRFIDAKRRRAPHEKPDL